MKAILYSIIGIGFILSFIGCDKLEGPTYFEERNIVPNDTINNDTVINDTVIKDTINKVLIEEFTGHKCGNCPRAHEKVDQLKDLYGDQVISVAFHAGFFALPSNSGESFRYDFRTLTGDAIDSYYTISAGVGLPAGLVNRTAIDDDPNEEVRLYAEDWATVIEQYNEAPVTALMALDCDYNAETRNVSASVSVNFLIAINKEINIVLYVTEDSIVNWQKDYDHDPVDIENYLHRHVFRDVVNSTWGDPFVSGSIAEGQTEEATFNYTLDEAWDENHCEIIAYIYDTQTKQIIQAEHEKLFP